METIAQIFQLFQQIEVKLYELVHTSKAPSLQCLSAAFFKSDWARSLNAWIGMKMLIIYIDVKKETE